MRIRMVPIATLVLTLAALASCAPKPIAIGFIGPLTGSSAPIGLGVRNGFLMAFGAGPGAAPGRIPPYTLIVKDDHNDPDACLSALVELKAAGCSVVILGTTSQAATKALPWAQRHAMLIISPTISTPNPAGENSLFIRINVGSDHYGKALADMALRRFGKKRVAIAGDLVNSDYVKSVVDSFSVAYTSSGGTVSFTSLFNSRTDKPADGIVQALRDNRSDGLLIVAASTEVVLIAKELDRAGASTQVFLPPWPLTLDLLHNGGKSVEGAVAVSIADLEFRSSAGMRFVKNYVEEYGEQPSFTAMFGYEAAMILRATLATGIRPLPRLIRDRILSIQVFDGLQGAIRFDAEGNAERDLFRYVIEHGAYKSID
jgi:branched-chain amino acid transport system substrate-binding protein